jgi:hypothetical protein
VISFFEFFHVVVSNCDGSLKQRCVNPAAKLLQLGYKKKGGGTSSDKAKMKAEINRVQSRRLSKPGSRQTSSAEKNGQRHLSLIGGNVLRQSRRISPGLIKPAIRALKTPHQTDHRVNDG